MKLKISLINFFVKMYTDKFKKYLPITNHIPYKTMLRKINLWLAELILDSFIYVMR